MRLALNTNFHDVRADGVAKTQIAKWAKAAGTDKLLNTRSTTWRGLSAAEKEKPHRQKGC